MDMISSKKHMSCTFLWWFDHQTYKWLFMSYIGSKSVVFWVLDVFCRCTRVCRAPLQSEYIATKKMREGWVSWMLRSSECTTRRPSSFPLNAFDLFERCSPVCWYSHMMAANHRSFCSQGIHEPSEMQIRESFSIAKSSPRSLLVTFKSFYIHVCFLSCSVAKKCGWGWTRT